MCNMNILSDASPLVPSTGVFAMYVIFTCCMLIVNVFVIWGVDITKDISVIGGDLLYFVLLSSILLSSLVSASSIFNKS